MSTKPVAGGRKRESALPPAFTLFELLVFSPFVQRLAVNTFRAKRLDAAFSLIEVTIALGIVAFAVVAVLGVIPTGMNTLRDSTRESVEAQIVRSIGGQLGTGTFTNVNTNFYCDVDGRMVSDTNSAIFTITTSNQSAVPSYPGSANLNNLTNFLKTVRLDIKTRSTSNSYYISVAKTDATNTAQ